MSDRLILSTQPELLRVNQKDEEYGFGLYQKVVDAIEVMVPWGITYRTLSNNQDWIRIGSTCFYYILTTLLNRKTLGEEFSNLAQFNLQDFDFEGIPTLFRRRMLFFILATIFPFAIKKILSKQYDALRNLMLAERRQYRGILASIIRNFPDFTGITEKIVKIHLCAFFLDGLFVQLSKRVAGIKYVFQRQPQDHNITYVKVGKLMAIQLTIEAIRWVYRVVKDYKASRALPSEEFIYQKEKQNNDAQPIEDSNEAEVPQELLCTLCYDRRKNTSSTPCGHLFCWECIIKSTQIKPECPNCRAACKPQKIVQLANFM